MAFTVRLTGKNLPRQLREPRSLELAGSGNPLTNTGTLAWTAPERWILRKRNWQITGIELLEDGVCINRGPLTTPKTIETGTFFMRSTFSINAGDFKFDLKNET